MRELLTQTTAGPLPVQLQAGLNMLRGRTTGQLCIGSAAIHKMPSMPATTAGLSSAFAFALSCMNMDLRAVFAHDLQLMCVSLRSFKYKAWHIA